MACKKLAFHGGSFSGLSDAEREGLRRAFGP
jgi:hypothetical protein